MRVLASQRIVVAVAGLCLTAAAFAEKIQDIHPQGYVTDLAGVVNSTTRTKLEALGTELEQKTGAQIAVVTVRSLEGESVEDYAVDLYKHLGVGSKKENRGVLLLLAPEARRYRVEVGYGLEPVINDARAGDIGRSMVPLLRQGDYSGAVETATWSLAELIAQDRGVSLAGAPTRRRAPQSEDFGNWIPLLIVLLIIGFPILAGLLSRLLGFPSRRGGRRSGSWWMGPGGFGGWGGGSWGGGGFGGSSGGFGGGGGFGGFGGGMSGGGGASGSW
jgi:uncharacterized protein